jgi:hypothetical protein
MASMTATLQRDMMKALVREIHAPARRRLSVHDFPLSEAHLAEWEGACLELVNDLLGSHPTGQILCVDHLPHDCRWSYHAALVLEGVVYDAWNPDVRLPPAEYTRQVFGEDAAWELIVA